MDPLPKIAFAINWLIVKLNIKSGLSILSK